MPPSSQIVISASRRTDIPAFYMPWFMQRIQMGFFEVVNPFNRHVTQVAATPDQVHTIVFWSKNFGPFLNGNFGEKLQTAGYHLFFNFTINSAAKEIEPNIPDLKDRLGQLARMARQFGADTILWRFDPVCVYHLDGRRRDNLRDFPRIAEAAARCGIQQCVVSFMDDYAKIRKRLLNKPNFVFSFPALEQKRETALKMSRLLKSAGIRMYTCCEKDLMQNLPAGHGIRPGSCIPNDFLVRRFGGKLSLKKDAGQRIKQGCGCKASVDIGSYQEHPCYHNCLFCYANPKPEGAVS